MDRLAASNKALEISAHSIAGVCDESPLAVKASDISNLRNQARSQRVPDAWHFAHERIFRQSLGESLHLC